MLLEGATGKLQTTPVPLFFHNLHTLFTDKLGGLLFKSAGEEGLPPFKGAHPRLGGVAGMNHVVFLDLQRGRWLKEDFAYSFFFKRGPKT